MNFESIFNFELLNLLINSKIKSFKIQSKLEIRNSKLLRQKGFSLIELMLVIAILVILATIVNGYYVNYLKNTQLDSTGKLVASVLIKARDKTMAGEADKNWGVHFVNGADDYYELFSSPTDYASASNTVAETIYLDSGVYFSSPAAGASSTVIFTKISGTSTPSSIVLTSNFGGTSTISVSGQGRVE